MQPLRRTIIGTLLVVVNLTATTMAQSGGSYDLTWNTIDGGGGTSSGGSITLTGTIGQPDAGFMSGGSFEFSGGFWVGASPQLDPPGIGDDLCDGGSSAGASCATDDDCPGGVCGLKSRFITVDPGANSAGSATSLQVTIASMPLFPEREGEVWWAGPSQTIPNAPHTSALGAGLVCVTTPSHAEVWAPGVLHLFGGAVIPGSRYEVRVCDAGGTNCSDPLTVATGLWGDVVANFGGSGQPNFGDISALVDKFKALAFAPDTVRTDLMSAGSEAVDFATNFADISADVDAFRGVDYPFDVP